MSGHTRHEFDATNQRQTTETDRVGPIPSRGPTMLERSDSRRKLTWHAANDPVTSAKLGKPARHHGGQGFEFKAMAEHHSAPR